MDTNKNNNQTSTDDQWFRSVIIKTIGAFGLFALALTTASYFYFREGKKDVLAKQIESRKSAPAKNILQPNQ